MILKILHIVLFIVSVCEAFRYYKAKNIGDTIFYVLMAISFFMLVVV